MKFLNTLTDWLIRKATPYPYFHLYSENEPYMLRYWVWPRYKEGKTGFGIRLHNICKSDDDRHFHNHPSWYFSFILRGGYWEVTPEYDESDIYVGDRWEWYGSGSLRFRRMKDWHRLVVPYGTNAWTLFFRGPIKQTWGFLKHPDYKVSYKDYEHI